jgi:hypothetical protein
MIEDALSNVSFSDIDPDPLLEYSIYSKLVGAKFLDVLSVVNTMFLILKWNVDLSFYIIKRRT